MLLRLLHRTTFVYAGQARDSFNEVRLRPRSDETQSCRGFALRITPESPVREYDDFYGNTVHYFDIADGHDRLVIEAESEINTMPNAERAEIPAVPFSALVGSAEHELLAEFFSNSRYVPLTPELGEEARVALAGPRGDVWSDVCRLGRHVYLAMAYRPKATEVTTLATDALKLRAGVCQDFAHVMLGLCRCAEIPARYVSGYFYNPKRRPGEVEASHAWVEAFLPGYGWAAYDPTHDRPTDERYVKVGVGRDYADISPASGTYRGAPTHSLEVEVTVSHLAVLPT